jgi:hypothetical protein
LGCQTHPDAAKFGDVVGACGVDGQSDDEEALRNGLPIALTERMPWRSPQLTRALRMLDFAQLGTKIGPGGHLRATAFALHRVTGTGVSARSPVIGLPRNCYDQNWLNTLDTRAVNRLKMRKAFDLSISPGLQRFGLPSHI